MSGIGNTRRRLLVAGSQAAGALALFAGVPGMRAALAREQADGGTGTVALAFDASSGSLYRARSDAVQRSGDDGRHWNAVMLPSKLAAGSVTALAVSVGDKGALYVAGRGLGVFRSDDHGRTWSDRSTGLASNDVAALTAHAEQPGTVYAYITGRGIFRSDDDGQGWRLMDAGPRGGITRFVHSNMPGSMQSGWLLVAGPQGVRRAMDCFCGWRDAGELGRAVRAVAYDPSQPAHVYAATDAGLVFSADGGESWSQVDGPTETIEALVVTPGGALYAAGGGGAVFHRGRGSAAWVRSNAS